MKSTNTILSKIVLLIGGILFIVACDHKPLYLREYSGQAVRINIDWSELIANGDQKPAEMALWYYSEEFDDYNKVDFATDSDSVVVYMAPGVEHLAFYTTDNADIEAKDVHDSRSINLVTLSPNKPVGTLYGGWELEDIVDNGEAGDTIVQMVTITPRCLNQHMRLHVKGLLTKENVNGVGTLVRNVVNNVVLRDMSQKKGTLVSEGTLYLTHDADDAYGTFSCIGFDKNAGNHYLYIYLMKPQNVMEYYYFDVEEQMLPQINNHFIDIEIDMTNASALQPGDSMYPDPINPYPDGGDSGMGVGVDVMPSDTIDLEL